VILNRLSDWLLDKFKPVPYRKPITPEGDKMDRYDVEYMVFSPDIPLKTAIERYKSRTGKEPTKAIVPVRDNENSPFHYDLEKMCAGARIEIETSSAVSVVMLTDYNITWRTG